MNRRNFIIGLGTAATLSGAASVTGAAVTNSVSPEANFQVVATEQLTVEKNPDLDLVANGNYSDVSVSNFDHKNATPFPNMTVNASENGNLGMALATNNTNSTAYNRNSSYDGTSPYNGSDNAGTPPLQITNNGGSSQTIAVDYNVGDAVTGAGTPSDAADLLAQVFTFSIDGTQISPSPGDTYDSGSGTLNTGSSGYPLGAGNSVKVDFTINYSDTLETELASLAGGGNYGFTGNTSAVDLLDEAIFGNI